MRRHVCLAAALLALAVVPSTADAAYLSVRAAQHYIMVMVNRNAQAVGTYIVAHRFGRCHRYSASRVSCWLALRTADDNGNSGVVCGRATAWNSGGYWYVSHSPFNPGLC
jgi:hypothetical protein